MKSRARRVLYSFPIQLVLLHIRKHFVLLLIWIFMALLASNAIAKAYGGPYLFLNPEYMSRVNSLGFMIIGFAIGGFIMTWQTCFYMLNSFRFKFLVSLARPFVVFCFNNSLIPLVFNLIYLIAIYRFQSSQGVSFKEILVFMSSMLLGQLILISLVILYFMLFNQNVDKFLRGLTEKTREKLEANNIPLSKLSQDRPISDWHRWPVESYFHGPFRIRSVRNVSHYNDELIKRVLRQHNLNMALIIVICVLIIFSYGFLLDNPIFRIPAGASLMLILSTLTALACLVSYWAGGWRFIVFATLIFILNFVSGFRVMIHKHQLTGLDYGSSQLIYSNQAVFAHLKPEEIERDRNETRQILDNWKNKLHKTEKGKPYIIFLQSSGGGLKAGYWGMHVLQKLEKATQGKMMDHTMMMSGASGGMIGSAYFRHLYLLHKQGKNINPLSPRYRDQIGKDLLNPIFAGLAANDLFFPLQTFKEDGHTYHKDRGYWFNKQLEENTDGLLTGKVIDYQEAERLSLVPMIVFSPTIVNDQRVLLISATPVSYLCLPYIGENKGYLNYLFPDGVDFFHFFQGKGAEHIDIKDAIRLNATYPFVLPTVYLPTKPEMKVMDAGLKDNHGYEMSTRFINVFRDWIERNTAGVIFIQIRSDQKLKKMDELSQKTSLLQELFLPIGNIYTNFIVQQDYNNDMYIAELANSLKVPVTVLPFIYNPESLNKEVSMSFHLTRKEKLDLIQAYKNEHNQNMEKKLKRLLDVED